MPSRVFLDKPYPEHLPVVPACADCNAGFSLDEQYVACLIECSMCGSADPAAVKRDKIARILRDTPALAARIAAARRETADGVTFAVEFDRVRNVVLKLARGHAAFELNEPQFSEPANVGIAPLAVIPAEDRERFEQPPAQLIWSEVGSRAMHRLAGSFPDGDSMGWIVVQPRRYRYLTAMGPGVTVRMVFSEFLAAEVLWRR